MQKSNRKGRIILKNILLIIAIFGSGVTFGKLLEWGYFILIPEISIIESFSLFITIGLAIYIASVLEPEKQDSRNEKDLLLKRTEDINKQIDDCSNSISQTSIPFFEIVNKVHRVKTSVSFVFKALDTLSINHEECELWRSYKQDIRRLRSLLTDTPINEEGSITKLSSEIQIKNNYINLSSNRHNDVVMVLEALKNKVFMLQVKLNRW